jgi:uncharacterized protein (TIGR00661 family)
LDWGLGHTTRSATLIHYILKQGHTVIFAGNEWQRNYISRSFPGIDTVHLDGYNVTYAEKGSWFMVNLLKQLPRLLKTIRYENDWIAKLVAERKIDAVISDNRYGLHHDSLPCVMMTHQVLAQTGMGEFADRLLSKIHYRHIRKYQQCWVIDVDGEPNLSGVLAHPDKMPENARFIGLLSQIADEQMEGISEDHFLILLSGPEPQRTLLSDLLWEQAKQLKQKLVFVEGSNNIAARTDIPPHISYHLQLTKDELFPLLKGASMVICRSGYSTLMDLVVLDKKAILIPTPGQTEQEYLGKYLHKEGVFFCMSQEKFNIFQALVSCHTFPFKKLPLKHGLFEYKKIVTQWLNGL